MVFDSLITDNKQASYDLFPEPPNFVEQVQCQPPGYVPKTLSHQSVASEVTTPTDERIVAVAPAAPVPDSAVPASSSPLPPAPAANPPLQSQPSRDGGILGKSPLASSTQLPFDVISWNRWNESVPDEPAPGRGRCGAVGHFGRIRCRQLGPFVLQSELVPTTAGRRW